MKPKLLFNSVSIIALASRAMLGNEEHLIVPVIGIREGVLNDIFYPESELSTNSENWNGVPIPVTHPTDESGNYITANSKEVEETHNIGRFFNVSFDKKTSALKGELWINIKKATDLGHSDLIERLEKGEKIDVSTGLWTNTESSSGNYKGKNYSGIARQIRPDHLAILPNEKGACSVEDGCGTFLLNDSTKKPCCNSCAEKDANAKERQSMFGNAFKWVGSILGFAINESSHNDIAKKLSSTLNSNFTNSNKWQYIVDVFSDFFVYEQDELLFTQEYKIEKDESITFIGDPTQVTIKKSYEKIIPKISTNTENKKQMNVKHITILAGLLAANSISAEQHNVISGLPDDVLDNFLKTVGPAPVANSSALTDADRQLLQELKADRDQRTDRLRAHVKKNCKQIPEVVVDTMTANQLEQTVAGISHVSNVTDFSFASGSHTDLQGNSSDKEYVSPSILLASA